MSFEVAPPAAFAPHEIHTFSQPNDPTVVLPEAAAAKFVQLKQRCLDLHSQVPEWADVRELAETKVRHQRPEPRGASRKTNNRRRWSMNALS